jgi:hypothetical protein
MKRITMLKIILMLPISLVSFGSLAGCAWGHGDHYEARDHHDDHSDVRVVVRADDDRH